MQARLPSLNPGLPAFRRLSIDKRPPRPYFKSLSTGQGSTTAPWSLGNFLAPPRRPTRSRLSPCRYWALDLEQENWRNNRWKWLKRGWRGDSKISSFGNNLPGKYFFFYIILKEREKYILWKIFMKTGRETGVLKLKVQYVISWGDIII